MLTFTLRRLLLAIPKLLAISLVIFLIVALLTFFNFRFTQSWEEISENV